MRIWNIVRGTGALALAAGSATYVNFRREMKQACAALEAGSLIIETAGGPIEFGREGAGAPALVIHGAGGGYDQGLMIGRDTLGSGFDLIAPSRFGYLRTPLGSDLSPSAQADAHAALLDALGIDKVVVLAASAGAPSAIELALRFPNRVSSMVLLVPRAYAPGQIVGPDKSRSSQAVLRLIEASADFAFWLGIRFARPAIVRFLGVPPELEARAAPEEREKITALMRSILPLSRRIAGIDAEDAFEMVEWPLHRVLCPTLIVSAEDDLFGTLAGARFTAEHINDAELKVFEEGGHLLVGHGDEVRKIVADFLNRQRRVRKAA
ncbi:MAG TPA: alpha/beta hydrolase [Allosphingosinicella sp.]|nr:alpha/beta hydrolase [Allosphingosinicella sp.]